MDKILEDVGKRCWLENNQLSWGSPQLHSKQRRKIGKDSSGYKKRQQEISDLQDFVNIDS